MFFEYLTLSEIRDLCESVGIFPCITKNILIKKINGDGRKKYPMKSYDAAFYSILFYSILLFLSHINDMPSLTQQEDEREKSITNKQRPGLACLPSAPTTKVFLAGRLLDLYKGKWVP